MAKFRKKPVVVDAERYKPGMEDGFNCYEFMGGYIGYYPKDGGLPRCKRVPAIFTLEGVHEITEGDWIITGIKGERYPCKPDIFKMTYEAVEERTIEKNEIVYPDWMDVRLWKKLNK